MPEFFHSEYLDYTLQQLESTSPISVFKPNGNLLNHFETESAARRAIRLDAIRHYAEQIVNILSLRD